MEIRKALWNSENGQPPVRTAEEGAPAEEQSPCRRQSPWEPWESLCCPAIGGLWRLPPTSQSLQCSVVMFCEFRDITICENSRFVWKKAAVLWFHRLVVNQTILVQTLQNSKLYETIHQVYDKLLTKFSQKFIDKFDFKKGFARYFAFPVSQHI